MSLIPRNCKYVVIGAGIHGMSTAYHLALELKSRGKGDGRDIIIVDKEGVAAGASGIACGVVRNNYFQPAMRELMMHSVGVWERDPATYSYQPVGFLQICGEAMQKDVAGIAQQQKDIGYESVLIEGEKDCRNYMKKIFHDWQAEEITTVLHEKKGGYANNMRSMKGLAAKARSEGVEIISGVSVQGFEFGGSGEITAVITDHGVIECDYTVIGAGPWVPNFWRMLDLPKTIEVKDEQGRLHKGIDMWKFWFIREGSLGVHSKFLIDNDGNMPPVVHVDSEVTLTDENGKALNDAMWGIYYKPDFYFGGVQGGSAPRALDEDPNNVRIDPYGTKSPDYVVGDDFKQLWVAALAHCQKRFEGSLPKYRDEPSGGIGVFTPDNFPVFDVFRQNCYIISDSNHGYKMLGVGELVASEICGEESAFLKPFRFERYAKGDLHPVSHSPFPWS